LPAEPFISLDALFFVENFIRQLNFILLFCLGALKEQKKKYKLPLGYFYPSLSNISNWGRFHIS